MSTPYGHPAAQADELLRGQCRIQRTRAGGPGGQRRNKVETAVRLVHEPTGLTVTAGERRSQAENERAALRRLRLELALKVRHEPGSPLASPLWESRREGKRLAINPRHADYPALLAEALDAVALERGDVADAAAAKGISSSQMVRLLAHHGPALALVNDWRAKRGLRALK